MDTDAEIKLRAEFVATLNRYQSEIRDIEALTFAAHHLTSGVVLTGDVEEMAEAEDAVEAAACLTHIAQRQARYLDNEIEEEIARVDVMSDEEDEQPDEDGRDNGASPDRPAAPSA